MPILEALLLAAAANSSGPFPGSWSGESICQVRPGPCHDEDVVFHFAAPDSFGHVTLTANKVVAGKEEFMGTIDCAYTPAIGTLVGESKGNRWRFSLSSDGRSMSGTLFVRGALFRKLKLRRL